MAVRLVLVAHAATAASREARFPGDEPLDERGAHRFLRRTADARNPAKEKAPATFVTGASLLGPWQ